MESCLQERVKDAAMLHLAADLKDYTSSVSVAHENFKRYARIVVMAKQVCSGLSHQEVYHASTGRSSIIRTTEMKSPSNEL